MGIETDSAARRDAIAVYRWLCATRREGGALLPEMAFQCFPTMHGPADPAYESMRKSGVRRTLDSIAWLRSSGVEVRCVPGHRVTDGGFDEARFVVVDRTT